MIDAVDLLLVQNLADLFVQRHGRIVTAAEWLFDDYAPPAVLLRYQPRGPELLDNRSEEAGRGCQIEKIIAARSVLLVDLSQQIVQLVIGGWIIKIARNIINAP